jgi:hypothetical protein
MPKFSTEIGGSYWYSELQNNRTIKMGIVVHGAFLAPPIIRHGNGYFYLESRILKMQMICCQKLRPLGI